MALLLLVLIPMAFNAIALLPELSLPIPSLNDNAFHYLLVQRAKEDTNIYETRRNLTGLSVSKGLLMTFTKM